MPTKFKATIMKIGINPAVDVPEKVLTETFAAAGRCKGPIPVRGTLNGADFVQTLVKFRGEWRLYINGPMLKRSGTRVDDEVSIQIEFDPRPREFPIPDSLASTLRKDKLASAAFQQLSPSRRTEICRYIGSLRSAAAVDRNIDRLVHQLRGRSSTRARKLIKNKPGTEG